MPYLITNFKITFESNPLMNYIHKTLDNISLQITVSLKSLNLHVTTGLLVTPLVNSKENCTWTYFTVKSVKYSIPSKVKI